jgi:hypothetical protein
MPPCAVAAVVGRGGRLGRARLRGGLYLAAPTYMSAAWAACEGQCPGCWPQLRCGAPTARTHTPPSSPLPHKAFPCVCTRARARALQVDVDTAVVEEAPQSLFQHNPSMAAFPPSNPMRGAMWKAASRRALMKRRSVASAWSAVLSASSGVVGMAITPSACRGLGACGRGNGGGGGRARCHSACVSGVEVYVSVRWNRPFRPTHAHSRKVDGCTTRSPEVLLVCVVCVCVWGGGALCTRCFASPRASLSLTAGGRWDPSSHHRWCAPGWGCRWQRSRGLHRQFGGRATTS